MAAAELSGLAQAKVKNARLPVITAIKKVRVNFDAIALLRTVFPALLHFIEEYVIYFCQFILYLTAIVYHMAIIISRHAL